MEVVLAAHGDGLLATDLRQLGGRWDLPSSNATYDINIHMIYHDMYVYIYIHTYIHICIYTYVYIHYTVYVIYIYVNIFTDTHIYIHTHMDKPL
jgi:hypothetical protein